MNCTPIGAAPVASDAGETGSSEQPSKTEADGSAGHGGNGIAGTPSRATSGTGGGNVSAGSRANSGAAGMSVAMNAAGTGGNIAGASGASGCPAGQLSCGGACVPSDNKNCGACNHDCSTLAHVVGATTCSADVCSFAAAACAKGWAHCGSDPESGCETDVTQPANCGTCGNVCPVDAPMCSSGTCVSGCPANAPTLCGQSCAEINSDAKHCGTCDNTCAATVAHADVLCQSGSCGFACTAGFTQCGDKCVDTTSDAANCGSCNQLCAGGTTCAGGRCVCPAGTHDCGGTCAKDDSTAQCGPSCTQCRTTIARAVDVCRSGQCSYMCGSGTTDCQGVCKSTGSDVDNCGRCGNVCTGGKMCLIGLCACPVGQHDCNGTCVSTNAVATCGLSCTPCTAPAGATATCDGLFCGVKCTTGVSCSNVCTDTSTSNTNCGGCGITCASGQVCSGGSCG
ncbi:MAG TPA: hypothetical protein VFG30_44175 [Polyangiales bacterium]|nr:hypothetical protein [Polyangiales bacterium]